MADPEFIYSKSGDKQRVVITGSQTRGITALVVYILNCYDREFDFVSQPSGGSTPTRLTEDNPVVIIEELERPTQNILKYHHHIGVISEIDRADEALISQFADSTQKGGVLIFTDTEPVQTIGKKERPGVTSLPYSVNLHTLENGRVILISSRQEKFPVKLDGDQNLRNVSAAKELLKKLGITSEQFYSALAGYAG